MLDTKTQSILAQLITHLRNPLYRNGYALASSAILTAAVGMVYWVLAARLYPPSLVGLNSAIISAMMLLGGIAQLNLSNANLRFIPNSGRLTPRLVRITYLVTLGVAGVISLVFLSQLHFVAPALDILATNPWLMSIFVLATMAWGIFALEDGVLTGLRQAPFVPVENTLYAIIKVVLMVELIHITPQLGVFGSWVIGIIIIVLPTTYYIFKRLIPLHVQETGERESPLVFSQLTGYIAGDYLGATAWLACTSLMPLLVTQLVGPTANAYYYLSWQISLLLYAITKSLGASMVVEAASHPNELRQLSTRIVIHSIVIIVPMILILEAGAPFVLHLFGERYASEGTSLLRWLLPSAIPYIVISADINIARVQRRIPRVAIVLVSTCLLVLGLSYWLLPRLGVIAAGYAWLGSETLIALGIVFSRIPSLKSIYGSQDKLRMTPVRIGPMKIMDPAADSHPLLVQITHPWRMIANWERLKQTSPLIPAIIQQIPPQAGRGAYQKWQVQYIVQTQTDRIVLALGPEPGPALILVKLPTSQEATLSQERQAEALSILNANPALEDLRPLLPVPLAHGKIENQPFSIERILPGMDARLIAKYPDRMAQVESEAIRSITRLHHNTLSQRVFNEAEWRARVGAPLELVCETLQRIPGSQPYLLSVTRLGAELQQALVGKSIALSWVHGDFVPDNLLVDLREGHLSGILDWELAEPDGFPILDIMQLLMATRRETQHKELGRLVVDLLKNPNTWSSHERSLIESALSDLPGHALNFRQLLLLFWLQHISGNLTKATRYRRHIWWIYANIYPVLQVI